MTSNEGLSEALKLVAETRLMAAATHKATAITDFAIITLLVDAGILTIGQVAQRIEQLRDAIPDGPGRERTIQQLRPIIHLLREGPKQQGPNWTPVVHQGGLEPEA